MTTLFARWLRRRADPLALLHRLRPGLLRGRRVIHVGAHMAQERGSYDKAQASDVHWIEASPKTYQRLVDSLIGSVQRGSTSHHAHLGLLADKDGAEHTLNTFSNDGMSSSIFKSTDVSHARWPDVVETGDTETVRSMTLDRFWADQGGGQAPALVVIDVQGAELLVIAGGHQTLGNASAVICEVSTVAYYEGGAMYDEVALALGKLGFEPQSTPRRHGDMLFLPRNKRDG